MHKQRLEAFSDGVFAIIITIMVLELKVSHSGDWASLKPLLPVVIRYVLSFIYTGIYWNNHHFRRPLHLSMAVFFGKPAFAFLAFSNSFCYGLDG